MKRLLILWLGLVVCIAFGMKAGAAEPGRKGGPMIAHNVYFSLKDNSPEKVQQLVQECHQYLAPLPGMVFYAAGTCSDMDRPVNDRDYDVALHCVFKDRAALEAYLAAPKHLEFVARHKDNWKQVRVFDSVVSKGD